MRNRGAGMMNLFKRGGDFEAFERCIEKTLDSCLMPICAYYLLPSSWHFVLWRRWRGDPGAFMQKLTVSRVRNCHVHRRRGGYGDVYQGRYKSFPVERKNASKVKPVCESPLPPLPPGILDLAVSHGPSEQCPPK
ncbi:MAG: hypothetical protein ACLP9L_36405 [Thermoguttaceae bacterium]